MYDDIGSISALLNQSARSWLGLVAPGKTIIDRIDYPSNQGLWLEYFLNKATSSPFSGLLADDYDYRSSSSTDPFLATVAQIPSYEVINAGGKKAYAKKLAQAQNPVGTWIAENNPLNLFNPSPPDPTGTYVPPVNAEEGSATVPPEDAAMNPWGTQIVAEAQKYLGQPYVWGGESPEEGGWDCTGFTQWVMHQLGKTDFPGHDLEAQWNAGTEVPIGQANPGDLVFFANTYRPGLSHVGIYMGNGQFIHAGSELTGITISRLDDPYWSSRLIGARRVSR